MAVTKEVFANCASCVAASTSGTTAPASGTTESWTVGTGSTSFPVANHLLIPATFFYVRDPADTTNEIVLVTDNNSSGSPGTAWSVTRGAGNTVPVAHATGATWVQVASHLTFQNLKQAPSATTTAATVPSNSASEIIIAAYQPTADELVAGATWGAIAFGTFGTGTATTHVMQWALYWGGSGSVNGAYTATGGAALCKVLTGTNCVALSAVTTYAAGSSFDVNGSITWLSSTTATANLNLFFSGSTLTTANVTAQATNATAGGASSSTAVTISGSGPIFLTAKIGGAGSIAQTGTTLTATAPLIFREA